MRELAERVAANLRAFERRSAGGDALRRAAVAIALIDDGGEPAVLLVKRSALGRNPSQWAFPGGRLERGESAIAAALREAEEEVGMRGARVLGLLDDFVTDSGFVITPVVVLGPARRALQRDTREIQSLHPVSLRRLDAEGVPRWRSLPDGSRLLQMPLRHDMVVHAPTGAMLWQFREVALHGRALRVSGLVQPEWTRR